jgi:hypothetical protein
MNRLTFGALFSASLAFWLTSGSVFAQGSKFEEARTHIEKWVQTRQLIARRNADWRVERESIAQTIGLLKREIDLLKGEIDKSEQVDSEADAEKKRITLSLEDLKKANKVVDAALWGMERQALALMARFPDPLKDRTSNVRSRIPLEKKDLRGRSAAERMQNVVAMLNEADRFNSAITLAIEVRKDAEGKDRQVQALYLGLGHAYYADQGGSFAGVGVPGAEGWMWEVKPELGSTIRKVIDIYENERSAEFVPVPVNIK